jgi:hypothetical protein
MELSLICAITRITKNIHVVPCHECVFVVFLSLQTVSTLLKSKSEQERRLLTALVNKVSCYFPLFLHFHLL